jgi:hypothetical protein
MRLLVGSRAKKPVTSVGVGRLRVCQWWVGYGMLTVQTYVWYGRECMWEMERDIPTKLIHRLRARLLHKRAIPRSAFDSITWRVYVHGTVGR